jgi:two-component system, NarL family, sensor histidine kinase BarA
MSYRSIKRVLGETSLELKCRLLFGTCLLVLITASFWLYGKRTNSIIDDQNQTTGKYLLAQDMVTRHWKSLENTKSFTDYMDLVKSLSKSFKSRQDYEVQFILPDLPVAGESNPNSLAPQDEWEADKVKRFLAKKPKAAVALDKEDFVTRKSPDGNKYYYYQPIRATSDDCLICHVPKSSVTGESFLEGSAFGKSVAHAKGDLMAVARLALSTEDTRNNINLNQAILIATAIITVFLAMVAAYAIVRYVIVKPLRHLRDVSDAISRGNTALRADIHTGDEFEELAVAFNRMLRHMTDAQGELRSVNANLDVKVDELAQANMRLYELNMLKSDFLATMSHELRTPLNSILGFSEVLGSIDALDDKQKRYVQNIQKSGRTLLEMINDVLDLAKIESGKMETRPSDFRIAQVVSAQCDMARPLTERKNLDLEAHVDAELPAMHQDQARVQQILNNLLSNAIKFTPEGGRITVSVRRDESNFMVLEVTDTGVGITPEDQLTIFEKFRQGKTAMPDGDAMTREHSGSGLGLSIVKEICRLLGGEVSLQSELGKGSTFTVRLPWMLEEQPRLDAAIIEGFDDFTKQRFEPAREQGQS